MKKYLFFILFLVFLLPAWGYSDTKISAMTEDTGPATTAVLPLVTAAGNRKAQLGNLPFAPAGTPVTPTAAEVGKVHDATAGSFQEQINTNGTNIGLRAVLAGASGGQTLEGGTAASEALTLASTHHATKGIIELKDATKLDSQAYFSGVVDNGTTNAPTYGTAQNPTIDWTKGNIQKITSVSTGGTTPAVTFTAPSGPCHLTLKITHEASTTAVAYTWSSSPKWQTGVAPALTNTSGAVDVINFFYDGSAYYGTAALNFQ